MLETIATWWCYVAGAMAAVGVYAVIATWAIDRLVNVLRIKRVLLEFYWAKLKAKSDRIPGG